MIDFIKHRIKSFLGIRNITSSVKELSANIKKYLPPNPVIVEAGAHLGFDSVGLVNEWPNATVHAFEPVPELYKELQHNSRFYPNIKTYRLALGERKETKTMFVSGGESNASSSFLEPKEHLTIFPNVKFEDSIVVDVVNLAQWAKEIGLKKIDLIWLDLQGYEYMVLSNAADLLPNIGVIYTEVNKVEFYKDTMIFAQLKEWFESKNFTLVHENTDHLFGEAVFVNNTLLGKSSPSTPNG